MVRWILLSSALVALPLGCLDLGSVEEDDRPGSDAGLGGSGGFPAEAAPDGNDFCVCTPDSVAVDEPMLLPDESVTIRPSWDTSSSTEGAVIGSAAFASANADLSEPNATYPLGDGVHECTSCYQAQIGSRGGQPAHWDLELQETLLATQTVTWVLHVGSTFEDVKPSDSIFVSLEGLVHNGIVDPLTSFDPDQDVIRAEAAIWVARVRNGWSSEFPAAGTIIDSAGSFPYSCVQGGPTYFTDVPGVHPACREIHYLLAEGVVVGGGGGLFKPDEAALRGQVAAFIARSVLDPPLVPSSGPGYDCSPGPTGVSEFPDLVPTDAYCPAAHYLLSKNVTDLSCVGGGFCATTNATRRTAVSWLAQMVTLPRPLNAAAP